MQQITRVRALEGEIARTIQSISGIKAARVHIVMSERANFRREEQQPSASVVIRYCRHRRATRPPCRSAIWSPPPYPALSADKVTVLDSSGTLLAAGDDPSNTSAARTLGVEQTVEAQIERQHPPRADALSRPGQFPRQRQGRRQHRPAADRGDHLRPEFARRALGAVRAHQREQRTGSRPRHRFRSSRTCRPTSQRRRPKARNRSKAATAGKRPPITRSTPRRSPP